MEHIESSIFDDLSPCAFVQTCNRLIFRRWTFHSEKTAAAFYIHAAQTNPRSRVRAQRNMCVGTVFLWFLAFRSDLLPVNCAEDRQWHHPSRAQLVKSHEESSTYSSALCFLQLTQTHLGSSNARGSEALLLSDIRSTGHLNGKVHLVPFCTRIRVIRCVVYRGKTENGRCFAKSAQSEKISQVRQVRNNFPFSPFATGRGPMSSKRMPSERETEETLC